mmetsp:Transcript_107616/g.213820  ORF Transcript_107616/g.213820 Transcript_107616/m.213820 type:complete len:239 (+) Transcript_107616:247-963(+)
MYEAVLEKASCNDLGLSCRLSRIATSLSHSCLPKLNETNATWLLLFFPSSDNSRAPWDNKLLYPLCIFIAVGARRVRFGGSPRIITKLHQMALYRSDGQFPFRTPTRKHGGGFAELFVTELPTSKKVTENLMDCKAGCIMELCTEINTARAHKRSIKLLGVVCRHDDQFPLLPSHAIKCIEKSTECEQPHVQAITLALSCWRLGATFTQHSMECRIDILHKEHAPWRCIGDKLQETKV